MNVESVVCRPEDLRTFSVAVLEAVGTPTRDAKYMADQIVHSNLAGHDSHGMRRLVEYARRTLDGFAQPSAVPMIDIDRGGLVRIDGNRGFGHVVMRDATDIAIERARTHGIAGIAVHNSEYAGRFAPFCEQAAAQGVATFMFVNDSGAGQDVAPPGGLVPRMATNPIAAGIPRRESPHIVLDMATAIVAMGRVSDMRDTGEPIPFEWVTSEGALKHVGGVKGFGLGLVAEALAGALTTAGVVGPGPIPDGQGVFIVAIDIAGLRPLDAFTAEVESFIDYIKDVPLEQGASPVRIPGESSVAFEAQRRVTGVELPIGVWQRLAAVAADVGVPMPATL